MKQSSLYAVICSFIIIYSCSTSGDHYESDEMSVLQEYLLLPELPDNYLVRLPDHLLVEQTRSSKHNTDHRRDEKATMGRVLFYDKALSINRQVSCASCHQANRGFAEESKFSKGFKGEFTSRNSLPLGNVTSFESSYGSAEAVQLANFGWDDSAGSIGRQSLLAIKSPVEMGMDSDELVKRVNEMPYYAILNKKAFGFQHVSAINVLEALEFFVNSIACTNTKFDRSFVAGQSTLTNREIQGMKLFNNHCASCHSEKHNRVEVATASNGLDIFYEDKGVGKRTGHAAHDGVFKVPFLRNIALTAPYMHDGRFETLRDVVDFYSEGIQHHPNLHEFLKEGDRPIRFEFSEDDKDALVAYLKTLTDMESMLQEKYSDPFK